MNLVNQVFYSTLTLDQIGIRSYAL